MKHCMTLVAALLLAGMTMAEKTDAEKNSSTEMNAKAVEAASVQQGGVKVVFIGNSITLHGAAPQIGWTNVWGMAASAKEKDYVHIVTRGIENRTGRRADVRVRNLADFERNFRTWDIAAGVQDLVAFQPDYLVFALGENAPNLATDDDKAAYRKAFTALVGAFLKGGKRPNVVVRGVFWANAAKDAQMAAAAKELNVKFVRTDVAHEPGMMAKGLFAHPGVAAHPGDKGMAETAKRILGAFFAQ